MTKLTLPEAHQLRYMTTSEAHEYLTNRGLSDDERAEYEPIIGRGLINSTIQVDPAAKPLAAEALVARAPQAPNIPRRMMFTTLWLLGGSYTKIGGLFGVSQQTILASVNKILPSGIERHKLRLGYSLTAEALEWYRDQWLQHADTLGTMDSPREMAEWLHNNLPFDGTE